MLAFKLRFFDRFLPVSLSLFTLGLGCGDAADDGSGASAAGGPGGPGGSTSTEVGGGDVGGANVGGAAGGEGGNIAVIPAGHPRIYLNDAKKAELTALLSSNTPSATRFRAFVDARLDGGDPYEFRGWHAALIYALTADTQYADLAIQFADDYVTEEEALIAAGERPNVAFDSYLEVGDRVGDVMLVYDWCFDRLTEAQRTRFTAWANQAVFNVWHPEEATWNGNPFPWSGWSIDDPVNNYYFSFLRATALTGLATYEENPEAPAFVDYFRMTKIGEQLVPRYEAELQGGGSREGTGYGVAMMNLFRLYDLWEQSTGESIDDLTTHARLSLPYMSHAIVPTLDRLAPIGDHARDSTAALFDYHRDYLLTLGSLYPNEPTTKAVRTLLAESSVPEMSQGFMRFSDFLNDPVGKETAPLASLYPAYHAEGIGHVFARSSWAKDATWLGLIGGAYSQSHAHHDQGSLLLFRNEWLAYDANVDSHSGIRQEEELHNLVRIESGGQIVRMRESAPRAELLGLQDDEDVLYFATDVTPIYDGQSPIDRVFREVVWIKPNVVVVKDVVTTSEASARKVYQLNTPITPSVSGRRARMNGASASLDLFVVEPASGAITPVSWSGTDGDIGGGFRIEVAQQGTATSRFLTVLSVSNEVSSASASGETVTATLTGGRTATVTFAEGAGPTVTVTGGGAFTSQPARAVETWPLLAN